MDQERPRRGRRLKPANRGVRAQLGLKITPATKDAIAAAAQENGRTLAAEVEARIERTFYQQGLLGPTLALAYGSDVAGILLILIRAFVSSGRLGAIISQDGKPEARDAWHRDPFGYDQAVRAVNAVMEAFRPEGLSTLPTANAAQADALVGTARERVQTLLATVADPAWGEQFPEEVRNRDAEAACSEARALLSPDLLSKLMRKS